jgi:hypothetical protein
MNEDGGLFSHEDRMRLGARHMGLMDAVEDPDLQQHLTDAHEALIKVAQGLEDQGIDKREVWMTVIGFMLGPLFPS